MAADSFRRPPPLPHAPPFRLVDQVLHREPPRRCVTLKVFSAGEALLEGAQRIPGSLVLEALCQSAAFLDDRAGPGEGRIVRMEGAELEGELKPGDKLVVTATLLEDGAAALKAECVGEVEGRTVARLKVLIGRERSPS